MTVLSETRERFLKAIVAELPLEQIAEIHFFHPIRQGGIESGVAVVAERREEADPASRFTIHTAHYRLVLKGPDRGKWDVSIVAEADAPLLTVDAVVRGVQRRSGDAEDVTRMTHDELAALLPEPEDSAA